MGFGNCFENDKKKKKAICTKGTVLERVPKKGLQGFIFIILKQKKSEGIQDSIL